MRGKFEPQYKIEFAPTSSQINTGVTPLTLTCPSDTADTFRGPNIPKRLNGTSYVPGQGGNGGAGGAGGNGGNGGNGGLI